jgi:hypothetical protein
MVAMGRGYLYTAFGLNIVGILVAIFVTIMAILAGKLSDAPFTAAIACICILSAVLTFKNARGARKPPEEVMYILYPQIKGTLVATMLSKGFFSAAGYVAGSVLLSAGIAMAAIPLYLGVGTPLLLSIIGDVLSLIGTKKIFGL